MPGDTIKALYDTILALKKVNQDLVSHNGLKEDTNFYLTIAGAVGTLIGFIAFYWQWKSKKPQDYVFKLAQNLMEKEDTQADLNKSKEELKSVENKLNDLQNQIKTDLPIEARKAVLLDRLDEAQDNMRQYFNQVQTTKEELNKLQVTTPISEELLQTIQSEIQPKHVLREKVSTNKTILIVISSIASIAFAILPHPFDNIIGVFFLLAGTPFLVSLFRYSVSKNSPDRQATANTIKLVFSIIGAIGSLILGALFFAVYFAERPREIGWAVSGSITAAMFIMLLILSINLYKLRKTRKKQFQ